MNHTLKLLVAWIACASFVSVHVLGCGIEQNEERTTFQSYRRDFLPALPAPAPLSPPIPGQLQPVATDSNTEEFPTTFNISSSGEATWNYPLNFPPGRNELAPQLTLSYASRAGTGILGKGFSLTGIGQISRCWPVRAQPDGPALPEALLPNNWTHPSPHPGVAPTYCLNGTRLIPRPNESSERFSPDNDPSTLIIAQGNALNPSSFTVYQANGLILGFGTRHSEAHSRREGHLKVLDGPRLIPELADSAFATDSLKEALGTFIATEWRQDTLRDRYGNEVLYDYDSMQEPDSDAIEMVLSHISWTANSAAKLPPLRHARLFYDSNSKGDSKTGFFMGLPFRSSKLLKSIEVTGPSGLTSEATHQQTQLWTYVFDYEAAGQGRADLLQTIQRCFPSGSCSAPIQFSWSGPRTPYLLFSPQVPPADAQLDYERSWSSFSGVDDVYNLTVGDFNRDGRDDVLYQVPTMLPLHFPGGEPTGAYEPYYSPYTPGRILGEWRMRVGTSQGLSAFTSVVGLPSRYGGDSKYMPRIIDIDRDGIIEVLIYQEAYKPNGQFFFGYVAYSYKDGAFVEKGRESLSMPYLSYWAQLQKGPPMSMGDFDGNGTLDMMRDDPGPNSAGYVLLCESTQSGESVCWNQINPNSRGATNSTLQHGIFGPTSQMYWPNNKPTRVFEFEEHLALDVDGDGTTEFISDVDRQTCDTSRLARTGLSGDGFDTFSNWNLSVFFRNSKGQFHSVQSAIPTGPLEYFTGNSADPNAPSGTRASLAETTFGVCKSAHYQVAVPTMCNWYSDPNSRTPYSRLIGDFNGDGLGDILSFPARQVGSCGCKWGFTGLYGCENVDYSKSVFMNINKGSGFAPAFATRNPWTQGGNRPAIPSLIRFGSPEALSSDYSHFTGWQSIDNGLRVVDLDRDGIDEIVQVSSHGVSPGQMTVFRLANREFSTQEINVPMAPHGLFIYEGAGTFEPIASDGNGPRMTQFGDFNGDGLVDIVTMGSWRANVYAVLQDSTEPNLVTGVSSTTTMGETLEYRYARGENSGRHIVTRTNGTQITVANHDAVYNVTKTCSEPQICNRNLGWVVAKQHLPTGAIINHSYADARSDLNGRGFLGVEEHLLSLSTGGQILDIFDLDSIRGEPRSFSGPNSLPYEGYIYNQLTIPRLRIIDTELHTETNTILSASGLVSVTTEQTPGKDVFRSTRDILQYDDHHVPTRRARTTSDQELPSLIDDSLGSAFVGDWEMFEEKMYGSDADCAIGCGEGWLIGRYPKHEFRHASLAQGGLVGQTSRILLSLEYEANSTEIKTSTKDVPPQWTTPDNYRIQTRYQRSPLGNVIGTTKEALGSNIPSNSPSLRTETWSFAPQDTEYIFPVRHDNAHGYPTFTHRYALSGDVVAFDDVNAQRTEFLHDEGLRLKKIRPHVGLDTNYSYSLSGDDSVVEMTRGDYLQKTVFNKLGQVVEKAQGAYYQLSKTAYRYDQLGRLLDSSLPFLSPNTKANALYVSYEYDSAGRMISVTRPGESLAAPRRRSTSSYDGLHTTQTSERNIVTETKMDALGRPRSKTTRGSAPSDDVTIQYSYSRWGLLGKIIHPAHIGALQPAETRLYYDEYGRRTKMEDPDIGTVSMNFTAFDEIYRSTDSNGGITSTYYDSLGRVVLEETPKNTIYGSLDSNSAYSRRNVFEYDATANGIGQIARATSMLAPSGEFLEGGVSTLFEYDSKGRQSKLIRSEGGTQRVFGYRYDDNLNLLKSIAYPTFQPAAAPAMDFAVEYAYDASGSISAVDTVSQGTRKSVWRMLNLNAAGEVTEERFGANIQAVHRYDDSLKLRYLGVSGPEANSNFQRIAYRWGADELIEGRYDLDLGSEEIFKHDHMARLTSWTVNQNCISNEWTYNYDPSGNLLHKERRSGAQVSDSVRMTYGGPSPHQVTSVEMDGSDHLIQYLAAGQVTSALGSTFKWTPFDLPFQIGSKKETTRLAYDAFGERVSATSSAGLNTITLGGLYELRTSLAGQEVTYNVYGREGLVSQSRFGMEFGSSAVTTSSNYVHLDHLGNPDSITTEDSGAPKLVERGRYEPFGERRYPWALAQPVSQAHTQSAYGFTGHTPEEGSSLINMGGRIYEPRLSRFVSADPIGRATAQGLNRYSYALNSPAMFTDPSGLDPEREQQFDDELIIGQPGSRRVVTSTNTEAYESLAFVSGTKATGPDSNGPAEILSAGSGHLDPGDRLARDNIAASFTLAAKGFVGGFAKGIVATVVIGTLPASFGVGLLVLGIGYAGYHLAHGGAQEIKDAVIQAVQKVSTGQLTLNDIEAGGEIAGNLASLSASRAVAAATRGLGGNLGSGACFAAGSLVHTETGEKSIEKIQQGDFVWAENEGTGEIALKRVVRTFVIPNQEVIEIDIRDGTNTETLRATTEHPFWTPRGWIGAAKLLTSDRVLQRSGTWGFVAGVRPTVELTTVYNFEVEGFHTYFVGLQGVLVHNACAFGAKGTAGLLEAGKAAEHHLLPRQFAKFFAQRGIDIHKYTVTLPRATHLKGLHGKGLGDLPGGWNQRWADFIKNNPNATAKDVYQQVGRMMDEFHLSDMAIHPYRQ